MNPGFKESVVVTSSTSGTTTRGGKRRLCGVPADHCCGALSRFSRGLREGSKSHTGPEDAFQCYRSWLLRQGYRQVGSREFESPHDGCIFVLTKKGRIGAMLRGGKEGRHMPSHFLGACRIG